MENFVEQISINFGGFY